MTTNNQDLIIKTAVLKHNLYYLHGRDYFNHLFERLINEGEIDQAIEEFNLAVKNGLEVPKDTKFVCFYDENGDKWHDEKGIYDIEEDYLWAEQNLIDIKRRIDKK